MRKTQDTCGSKKLNTNDWLLCVDLAQIETLIGKENEKKQFSHAEKAYF